MNKPNITRFTSTFIVVLLLSLGLSVSGCGSSKQKASGDMKKTQYCERYREFDGKVATAKPKKQKELLVAVTTAKEFPQELTKDYETVIDGYTKYLAGESVKDDEDKYKDASTRISRHAIDHCELLKGNSGSSI